MSCVDCPFQVAQRLVPILKKSSRFIVVDIHAEATSEKIAMGWFLDGQVSAVLGTHTHVQTADERVLPGGTAYITDVGMTGPHDSVIGIRKEIAMERFLTQMPQRFTTANGDLRLNAVVIRCHAESGLAEGIERIQLPLET
jgi:metallophosphoesterase (TIGR00282 family)